MKIDGAVLKRLRKQNKISQEKLATILCVSTSKISSWERGIKEIDPDSIELLADYFQIPVSSLTEMKEYIEFVPTGELSREELYLKENVLLEKLMKSFERYAKEKKSSTG